MKQLARRINLTGRSLSQTTKLIHAPSSLKGFKQTNDLHKVIGTAELEEKSRSAKFVEYSDKVYKPSKTIQFDRNGELLLFSCDNIKHSQIYLKYPYIMIDCIAPIAVYNFFVDPRKILYYII
jgi:hypothetical protein